VKKSAVMLAAVETVTEANPVWESQRNNLNVAARATVCEAIHAVSPLKSSRQNIYSKHHWTPMKEARQELQAEVSLSDEWNPLQKPVSFVASSGLFMRAKQADYLTRNQELVFLNLRGLICNFVIIALVFDKDVFACPKVRWQVQTTSRNSNAIFII